MRHDANSDAAEGEAASVRTFLIADLRGYTRYSDEHGDEAASALARSFAVIASEAVGAHGGDVIELRGDEALCVFASARSAVRGAVELQRRARERVDGEPALPLGVGIGLDAGEAVPTAGGYRSRALNVAARLCSLARGGEILATPSNTYVGLTRRPSTTNFDEPDGYYPTGQRNYARVLPADDVQAAADAIVARRLGVKRVYAVDEGSGPSAFFIDDFIRAARRLEIEVAGRESLDTAAKSYDALGAAIAQSGADGVLLGVSSGPRSVRLLTDLRARLGRATQFMAPDGFDPDAAVLAGAAAERMTISQPGPANDHLGRKGKQFVAAFSKKFGTEPTRYAVNAAQAIDVLLDAIARSDGTRGSVTRNLFRTRISNGILGSFSITPTGDTTLNAVAIYRIIGGEVKTFATVFVPDALVAPE